ncbi:hypothetical protein [Mesoflavibacter sp. SCSIO 43206]|uniref:hypothetical protein n=1 Tax=Mesoflavibacter sp. SCSIO 43206 TaxID=2779362 RepID=UPI001CA8D962|nr:hypothetical protein [Mesoflavibacter sp. SCSIO 43206]UAB75745.1 hypothetical protein INR78_01785 [Mesoflavibacter sp. SCSIO 43206]
MKGNFLKIKPNKRFNYTPRYFKGKDEGNVYEIGSKIEKSRNTTNFNDYGSHWKDARKKSRNRGNREISYRLILIILILVLIFLYIIDFDLSIFRKK